MSRAKRALRDYPGPAAQATMKAAQAAAKANPAKVRKALNILTGAFQGASAATDLVATTSPLRSVLEYDQQQQQQQQQRNNSSSNDAMTFHI